MKRVYDRRSNLSSGRKGMNAKRVMALRMQGLKSAEIGRVMAAEEGRPVPYQAHSIDAVIGREKRRRREYEAYLAAEAADAAKPTAVR